MTCYKANSFLGNDSREEHANSVLKQEGASSDSKHGKSKDISQFHSLNYKEHADQLNDLILKKSRVQSFIRNLVAASTHRTHGEI